MYRENGLSLLCVCRTKGRCEWIDPLIFIVDDESKIRRLVAVNLESSGFDVMTADDLANVPWKFYSIPMLNPT